MRKLLLSVAALGSLAAAVPASAQWSNDRYDRGYGYGQGYGGRDYDRGFADTRGQIQRLARDIDFGFRNGSLTGDEARGLRRELGYIAQLDRRYGYDGYRGYEARDVQARLARLAERIRYEARDRDYRGRGYDRGYDNGYQRDWRRW